MLTGSELCCAAPPMTGGAEEAESSGRNRDETKINKLFPKQNSEKIKKIMKSSSSRQRASSTSVLSLSISLSSSIATRTYTNTICV